MLKKRVLLSSIVISVVVIFSVFYLSYAIESVESPYLQPCFSLTFDDGIENHYAEVFLILKERKHKATFFVIADVNSWRGDPVMMDAQLLEMQDEGFEIGSHSLTHPIFTSLSQEDIIRELKESKSNLESKGLEITSFAFPFSTYDKEILAEANKHYEIVRDNYNINSGGYMYNAQPVYTESNMEDVCGKIKEAKMGNKWLIFVLHKIETDPSFWDISGEDFTNLLECAENEDLEINTLKQCRIISGEFSGIRLSPEIVDVFYRTKPIGY